MKLLGIPFQANTTDDLHCFEASLKMVLNFFEPNNSFSFDKLDEITGKKQGLSSWPQKAFLWMYKRGYDIQEITLAPYEGFIERGKDYLVEVFGQEAADWQEKYSDIPLMQSICKEYISIIPLKIQEPTIGDIRNALEKNIVCNLQLNSRKLNSLDGYFGHSVIVNGYTDGELLLHDPGLPPTENRSVDESTLEAAWAFPDVKAKSLFLIRKK